MSRAIAGIIVGSLFYMGCIITKDPSYTPALNTPPVVLSHPDSPMDRFTVITLSETAEGDGGVSQTIPFTATVYDPDITQDLEGILFLDYNEDSLRNAALDNPFSIPPNGTTRREVRVEVQRTAFSRGCQVLSLHVSERFTNVVTNPVPASTETPPDLGQGIWWLHVRADSDDVVELVDCRDGSTP